MCNLKIYKNELLQERSRSESGPSTSSKETNFASMKREDRVDIETVAETPWGPQLCCIKGMPRTLNVPTVTVTLQPNLLWREIPNMEKEFGSFEI